MTPSGSRLAPRKRPTRGRAARSDESAPSKEEVLREGEALASKVDAVVEGGEVPDKDDAKPLLDGVKDRIGDAFNK